MPRRLRRSEGLAVAAIALAAFVLAYLSRVDMSDSDAGLALVAAQGVLEHRTLSLEPFRQNPRFSYRLDASDRRVEWLRNGIPYYHSIGAVLLPLPAVWIANRVGYDMLDREVEYATQRLLSAVAVALLSILLYSLCRGLTEPAAATLLTVVFVFGSPLMSTLGTALWSSHYAALAITGALVCLVQASEAGSGGRRRPLFLLAVCLLLLAPLARPAAAILVVSGLPFLFGRLIRPRFSIPLLLLCGALAIWIARFTAIDDSIPDYYEIDKLTPKTPLGRGLYGTLFSPSRGLFVFCPFLIPVVAAVAWRFRRLRNDPLFGTVLLWICLHTLAVSVRSWWWGGHSYGPRLFIETLPGFALLAALSWRETAGDGGKVRRTLAGGFVLLGLVAIPIHSGQGLFNPAVRRFNESPNVDKNFRLLLDWRYPQFLTSEAALRSRLLAFERESLGIYRPGEEIGPDSDLAIFIDWHESEGRFRWSRGRSSELLFRLGEVERPGLYLLELEAAVLDPQGVAVAVNGIPSGEILLRDGPPQRRLVGVPASRLRGGEENRIVFSVPGARRTENDLRVLGMALHRLELERVSADFDGLTFADDRLFGHGFSAAESGWRWTDGKRATLLYPLAALPAGPSPRLEIVAGSVNRQRAEVVINGGDAGTLLFNDPAPRRQSLPFSVALLRPYALNEITLELPDARPLPDDRRRLGLSIVSVRLAAGPPTDRHIPDD